MNVLPNLDFFKAKIKNLWLTVKFCCRSAENHIYSNIFTEKPPWWWLLFSNLIKKRLHHKRFNNFWKFFARYFCQALTKLESMGWQKDVKLNFNCKGLKDNLYIQMPILMPMSMPMSMLICWYRRVTMVSFSCRCWPADAVELQWPNLNIKRPYV